MSFGLELLIHLGAKTMHQHNIDAHALDHGQVLYQARQFAGFNGFACDGHHKGFAAVHMDVRRYRAEPGDEGEIENSGHMFESLRLEQNQLVIGHKTSEVAIECTEFLTRLHDRCSNPCVADQITSDALRETQLL